jgi:DNA-binding NarL/FixJ family response regulator
MIEERRIRPAYPPLLAQPDRDSRTISDRDHGVEGRHERHARPGKTVRVLIAESYALVRAGYRALLEREERIEVIAEAASGRHAIALATATRPDVVVLDVGQPGLDAIETAAAIASQAIDAALMLIVPREADESVVIRVVEAGATGVIREDAEPDELIRAVQLLAAGDALLPAGTMRGLLAQRAAKPLRSGLQPSQLEELTAREREVTALAASGLRNGEIAQQLVISPKTAKTHISRAMVKLGAHHRAQLVILAFETGLVLAPPQGATRPAGPSQPASRRNGHQPDPATQNPRLASPRFESSDSRLGR